MPSATYRVQLHAGFRLDDAAGLAGYLADLGISHMYCSPYLQAAPGSTHGYDVVDHRRVNEELGGEAGHARLIDALAEQGLGQVLDIVPNHMAIASAGNTWWWDVLENGPASRYASYFDVDWDPPQARLRNTVLLPILGDHYGRVLEAGELQLVRRGGRFEVHYHEHRMPVAPRSLDVLLAAAARRSRSPDLGFIADACGQLPVATATDRESVARRHRDKEVLYGQLARLTEERPEIAEAVDAAVASLNADPDRLDELLSRQNYRLAYWRTAGRELDYRRFFDVQSLAALRAEDERVFADTHALVLSWVERGVVDGLRIDHPDGLYDPGGYFERLSRAAPDAWVVAEKILARGECLPAGWPVAGTTGYDFLNRAGGLFVDPAGEAPLTDLYRDFTGEAADWPAEVKAGKLLVLDELLASDGNRVAERFREVCERHRRHRDYTRHELRQAVREVAACLPVYRTYVRAGTSRDGDPSGNGEVSERDISSVEEAIAAARLARPDLDPRLLDFFRDLLLLRVPAAPGDSEGLEEDLAMRFQQLTGPVMAKGVEDTAFYRFNRLVALNEVGGDPGSFGLSPEGFHCAAVRAAARRPTAMLATSTHDTKRSEDVRARLALLSEIPERWAEAVRRWSAANERYRTPSPGTSATFPTWPTEGSVRAVRGGTGGGSLDTASSGSLWPDRNAEYLFYQTLVGAWPLVPERAWTYMEKAVREAKRETAWTRPNLEYERALRGFVEAALADSAFTAEVEAFVAPLVAPGRINSLAQTLLKLASPGVPDFYQGTEVWDLSLVDPDNRRPVDYETRRRLLASLHGEHGEPSPEEILARADEGLPKLWLIRQGLALRRRRPELFGSRAGYLPLTARGERAGHLVAFARSPPATTDPPGEAGIVAAVPRLVLGLGGRWQDTTLDLPPGPWHNVLTAESWGGGPIAAAALLGRFPVALLEGVCSKDLVSSLQER